MDFINRLLRPIAAGTYAVLVNGETITTVQAATVEAAKVAAADACTAAEEELDDFFFEITEVPEPEMGCTHVVIMAARGSGRVIEHFTTDNPYGAVEAAREAQVFTFEERMERYAEMGL